MPATPKARKPAYIAASAARGGRPAWAAMTLGSRKLRTAEITAYSAARATARGACPSSRHAAAQGSSTVPVPNTGRASTSAVTAASSRAYRWPISRKPASSSQNVTPSRMAWARNHFPRVDRRFALTPRALSSRVPSWRRKKAMIRG